MIYGRYVFERAEVCRSTRKWKRACEWMRAKARERNGEILIWNLCAWIVALAFNFNSCHAIINRPQVLSSFLLHFELLSFCFCLCAVIEFSFLVSLMMRNFHIFFLFLYFFFASVRIYTSVFVENFSIEIC